MGFCELADVKAAQRIPASQTAFDELIAGWIDAAADLIVDATNGRQIQSDTAPSARVFEAPSGGRDLLIDDLSAAPTLVEALDDTLTATATITTNVIPLPLNRSHTWEPFTKLRLLPAAAVPAGEYVRVTGVWGFPAVPDFVRVANVETVREWLRGSQALTTAAQDLDDPYRVSSRGLPPSVRRMLRPITWPVVA